MPISLISRLSLYAAAGVFLAAGFLHLVRPAPFVAIVPSYVPAPRVVVLISGLAEIAGGLGLLVSATRHLASWGLSLLLVMVFPANVYMAVDHVQFAVPRLPDSVLWARLLLQPLLIWWVLALGRYKERIH